MLTASRAWAVPSLGWKGTIAFPNNTSSVTVSVPVGQSAAVGDELLVFLTMQSISTTVTPPVSTGVTWSTFANSCGNTGSNQSMCVFTGQVTSTQAASTSYVFSGTAIGIDDIWDVKGSNNTVDYIHMAQSTYSNTTLMMNPTLSLTNDFVGGMIANFSNNNFGTIGFNAGWTGTPTNANSIFSAGNGMGADFYNVQTNVGSVPLGVNWTTNNTFTDYIVVALQPASGGTTSGVGYPVFNCSSGFTAAGVCGVGGLVSGNGNFQVTGTQSGTTPALSGTQINLINSGANHAALSLMFNAVPVNVQAFTSTVTFIPNGQNFVWMLNNSNNNTSFNGANFSAGAGCEADFFQGFSQTNPPNNVFALMLDSFQALNSAAAFTYSSAQIYRSDVALDGSVVPFVQCGCIGAGNCGTNNASGGNIVKLSTSPVPLNNPPTTAFSTSTHTFSETITYDGSNVTLSLYDVTAGGSCPGAQCFTNTWTGVNIPASVGNSNTAWLGVGSATGSANFPTTNLYVNTLSYTVNPNSSGSSSLSGFFYVP